MSEWIPTPRTIIKTGINVVIFLAIMELLGQSNWVTSPVSSFKKLIGQG